MKYLATVTETYRVVVDAPSRSKSVPMFEDPDSWQYKEDEYFHDLVIDLESIEKIKDLPAHSHFTEV